MMNALFLSAIIGFGSVAQAAEGKKTADIDIHGYVAPQFQAVWRPDARPADQSRLGMTKSKAGLIFDGQVSPAWGFKVHFVLGGETFNALTSASPVDQNNDGTTDAIYTQSAPAISDVLVESSVSYQPVEFFTLQAGRMRIPFTSQAQSANTALMFPERSGPNQAFIKGSDMGALAKTELLENRIQASIGVFNGNSTNALTTKQQGILYTSRIDINPLGAFGFSETSEWAGPFLVGLGSGLIYNPYTAYDDAGYATVSVKDTRYSLSGRMSFYGLYVVGEFLSRQQLDSMTSRPVWGNGWYGQAGWHLPLGFEPVFRMGESTIDQSFDAQTTKWLDVGLNYYPAVKANRIDQVKITVHYLSENRVDEGETAQGLSVRVQVTW